MQLLTPTTILAQSARGSHEVKRSLFQSFAEPLEHPDQVDALLAQHRDPDARHHCWAWRCDGEYRFNDDGEPAGTAGRPILQALEGAGLDCTLVIVRRYFGGIKLGAGGLVRAYSASATACLQDAQTRRLVPHVELKITAPFEHTQALFLLLNEQMVSAPEHSGDGISVTVLLPSEEKARVLDELRSQTRGQIAVEHKAEYLA